MPAYRSIVVAQENDPTWWYFAQVAATLPDLERQTSYDAIDRVRKTAWNAGRVNDDLRIIADNATGNTISVVSYQQVTTPAFMTPRPAIGRKPKAKKAKPRKAARKSSPRKKTKALSRKKTKSRKR